MEKNNLNFSTHRFSSIIFHLEDFRNKEVWEWLCENVGLDPDETEEVDILMKLNQSKG
jgi:hypothetical protein